MSRARGILAGVGLVALLAASGTAIATTGSASTEVTSATVTTSAKCGWDGARADYRLSVAWTVRSDGTIAPNRLTFKPYSSTDTRPRVRVVEIPGARTFYGGAGGRGWALAFEPAQTSLTLYFTSPAPLFAESSEDYYVLAGLVGTNGTGCGPVKVYAPVVLPRSAGNASGERRWRR